MRVLIVSRGYPTEKYRMNGIFEFDQAKALKNSGVDVIYVALDVRSIRRWRKWGVERIHKEGIDIYAVNIPCGRIPKKILNIISQIALKVLYSKIVKECGEPDIIHTHFIKNGYIVAQAFNNSNIPLVLTEHYSEINKENIKGYYRTIGKITYPQMDKVIAVSNYLANNIRSNFGVDVTVIPNVVDFSIFNNICKSDEILISNKDFTFLSVGRLHKDKRMDLLIKAFYTAFSLNKDVKLIIYGEGHERENLLKLIDDLDLTKQVYLKGQVDRRVIAEKMRSSHCFVLASRLETFGVAFIEAMAVGLPVITTKCGGPEDFINEKNGVVVPNNSVDSLAEVMLYMRNNISKYNRNRISEDIIKVFKPKIVANQLIEEYTQVMKLKITR